MADKITFPSAIHAIRYINDNIIDNLLVRRASYIQAGSIYHRAYALVYETGESEVLPNVAAPDESTSLQLGINIISGNG